MTPTKIPIDLCQPSTSTSVTTMTESSHLNKSISDYLQNTPENKRKSVRNTERIPFVITSENFRLAIKEKEMEKQEKENQKMERKRKREEKREHALKTKKGKGVGKKSKNINKNKENIDIKTETENAKEKNIKTEIETDNKLRILSNIVIVTCDVCRRLADKNKLQVCSSCKKYYHRHCIPQKHLEHMPDDDELPDFICHNCFSLNDDCDDDCEFFEDKNDDEDMF
ncbi:hypothetical protein EVAR_14709_1 [Eumeta japonica]|uniref:Zinc finger PHD-type domain-containing protein n=1 Tax=Eumeta variegata TaxID=151549 RepID=A0A4C1U2H3_EUMVA|nr:hypothetical protein EVAR_14709_1 [Eumeta japonica]